MKFQGYNQWETLKRDSSSLIKLKVANGSDGCNRGAELYDCWNGGRRASAWGEVPGITGGVNGDRLGCKQNFLSTLKLLELQVMKRHQQ